MAVVMALAGRPGEAVQPAGDLAPLAAGRVQVAGQQGVGIERFGVEVEDRRGGVDFAHRGADGPAAVLRHRRFGQYETVGDRRLLDRFRMAFELGGAVHRIDDSNDAAEPEMMLEYRLGEDRVGDGRRVGEARSLDGDAPEGRDFAALALGEQAPERALQVAADGAAQTAAVHQQHAFLGMLDQVVVEADLAEFVDEHGGVAQGGRFQQPGQQGRLAAAEEAGDDVDRDQRVVDRHGAVTAPAPSCRQAGK